MSDSNTRLTRLTQDQWTKLSLTEKQLDCIVAYHFNVPQTKATDQDVFSWAAGVVHSMHALENHKIRNIFKTTSRFRGYLYQFPCIVNPCYDVRRNIKCNTSDTSCILIDERVYFISDIALSKYLLSSDGIVGDIVNLSVNSLTK